MQLRGIEIAGVAAAFVAGILMAPSTLAGDSGRLLVTFLSLVSASILPTISLIMASMTASGRSVKAINDLNAELTAAVDALFALFGIVGVSVIALIALAIPTPPLLAGIPFLNECLNRGGQGVVGAASALVFFRAGMIPGILRRSLEVRHRIAVEEAVRKTSENAAKAGPVEGLFPRHPEFGKIVSLEELHESDKSH